MPLSDTTRTTFEPEVEERESSAAEFRGNVWIYSAELLWSKRRRIGAWVLVGLVLSLGIAWKYPKYESVAQLMPPDNGSSALSAAFAIPAFSKSPGLAGLSGLAGDMMGLKSTGALFAKIIQSRTIEDELIRQFKLREIYGTGGMAATREKLLKRTSVDEDKKSGVISIAVRDHDPQRAMALTAAYIEELNKMVQTVATSAARRERVFLEQRLVDEKKTLDDAQQQFSQFASKNMALDIPEQTKVTVEAASRLQGELIANRAQLESLEQIYAPENYRVKSLRANVAELERELAKLNTGKTVSSSSDPTSPYPSVRNLPVLGVQWSNLYRETKIHETVYELLTQQYELARIQEAKEMPAVKVLDSPSVPETRIPSPFLIVLAGIIMSALLACAGILLGDRLAIWSANDPRGALLSRVYSGTRESLGSILPGRRRGRQDSDFRHD